MKRVFAAFGIFFIVAASFFCFSDTAVARDFRGKVDKIVDALLNREINVGVIAIDDRYDESDPHYTRYHVIPLPYLDAQSLADTEFVARTLDLGDKHCPIKIECKVVDAIRTEGSVWEKVNPNDIKEYGFAFDVDLVYMGTVQYQKEE